MTYLKIRYRTKEGFPEGKYHDDDSLHDVVNYIMQSSKALSGYIGGIAVDPYDAVYQMEMLSMYYGKDHGVRLRHMILAFTNNELGNSLTYAAEKAERLAYLIALYYGREYQTVYAVHENTDSIHIHFVMNTTSYLNGRKYVGTKGDLYKFINHIKSVLSSYSINPDVQLLNDDEDDNSFDEF